MLVKQITNIIDQYEGYKRSLRKSKSDLYTYRINNALINGEDENTIAMQEQIAETEAQLGKFLDMEV